MNQGTDIAVIFALKIEARHFSPPPYCRVFISGMGEKNARRCAIYALKEKPRLVLSCGFAGALNDRLTLNTIVFDAPEPWRQTLIELGAKPAKFYCSRSVATTAVEKTRLRNRTSADAIEMESGVIAEECLRNNTPCITIRIISDTANEDLPIDCNKFLTPQGKMRYGALVKTLAKDIRIIPEIIKFQKRLSKSSKYLGGFLNNFVRELKP